MTVVIIFTKVKLVIESVETGASIAGFSLEGRA